MQITVRLFAAHREAVGAPAVTLIVPAGTTAEAVWPLLVALHPPLHATAAPSAYAVNDDVAPAGHPLGDGDTVALLAPVSGGGLLELTREAIRVDALLDAVRDRSAGAVVLFLGVVRDHARGRQVHHLEYEAYDALARKELARIAARAIERWKVRIAIVHRLGHLDIGEISVAIATSSAHRADAFEAGRFAIDTLKQTVPIWKKEVWADGAEWIGRDDAVPNPPAAPTQP